MLRLTEGGQISLELAHLRSHDPGTAHDGFLHGGLDPAVKAESLGLKVNEGDAHVGTISRRAGRDYGGVQRHRGCGVLPNRSP
jgi:hypothetical protein